MWMELFVPLRQSVLNRLVGRPWGVCVDGFKPDHNVVVARLRIEGTTLDYHMCLHNRVLRVQCSRSDAEDERHDEVLDEFG